MTGRDALTATDPSAELAGRLEAVLGEPVIDLRRLTGGASRETWSFRTTSSGGRGRELILQRERPGGTRVGSGMHVDAALLVAAADAGVPVPRVVLTDSGADALGASFLVMERVEGETIPRRLLRDPDFAAARPVLAHQAGAALAAVHRMDTDRVEELVEIDQVAQFRDLLDVLGEAHPAFELGLRWLEDHRPRRTRTTVVHGDFRTGNLIVGEEGLRAVLDWELAHLGQPAEDLGWFCVRAWRFGSPHRAGGFGPVEDLIAGYAEAGGEPPEPDELNWWEALGTMKWGVMCIIQAETHLSGQAKSVELAAIGRRACENEEDLLALIAGTDSYEPRRATGAPPAGMPHDRPTSWELLDAVGDYLGEVRDAGARGGLDRRLAFHARVASNVVAMLQREIELGPDQASAHADRLRSFGVADDAEWASAIRSGALDDRLDEVTAAVRASVRDKLAVANPGYWEVPG